MRVQPGSSLETELRESKPGATHSVLGRVGVLAERSCDLSHSLHADDALESDVRGVDNCVLVLVRPAVVISMISFSIVHDNPSKTHTGSQT